MIYSFSKVFWTFPHDHDFNYNSTAQNDLLILSNLHFSYKSYKRKTSGFIQVPLLGLVVVLQWQILWCVKYFTVFFSFVDE